MVLYLFLWQLAVVIWRDLRRAAAGEVQVPPPTGRLVVLDGGGTSYEAGHSFPLGQTTTIGRGPDNSIVLSDGFVSTNHAALSFRDGSWWLSDLGSRNGTWVNGQKVTGEVRIGHGDVVSVGQIKMKLVR